MLYKQFVVPQGLKKLQSEIAVFEKQKTEELERLEQFREEELRKLRYGFVMIHFVTVDVFQEIIVRHLHIEFCYWGKITKQNCNDKKILSVEGIRVACEGQI